MAIGHGVVVGIVLVVSVGRRMSLVAVVGVLLVDEPGRFKHHMG